MVTILQLPKKLNKEPLIDAIFEIRFSSAVPASGILPGFLYSKLEGNKIIKTLSASQFPKAVRDADPNLKFAPLSRLEWNDFWISISDRSVSISCKLPYPGWLKFKSAILQVLKILDTINIIELIERYSMKYVDLIPSNHLEEQISFLNFDLIVAGQKLKSENFQIRVEIPQEGFINAIQLVSSAIVKLENGATKNGVIIDVDSIMNLNGVSLPDLLGDFQKKLDALHHTNKTIFFACLKSKTIDTLEPIYE